MSDQSGLIDGVQFDKDDPATRLFIAANYWREKAEDYRTQLQSALSAAESGRRDQRGLLMEVRLCVESYRQKEVATPAHLTYDKKHVPALLKKIDTAIAAQERAK